MFFPPVESALFSIGHLSYGGYLLYAGGRLRRPPASPWAFTTKNVEKRSQKMNEHSTGSQGVLHDGLRAFNNPFSPHNEG